MTYQQLLVELKNNILYITINRPQKLNALNKEVLTELAHAVATAQTNKQVNAILLTGAGEKAFVAGADISEFQNYNSAEGKQLAKHGHDHVFDAIESSSKPIIAAINGFALKKKVITNVQNILTIESHNYIKQATYFRTLNNY